jgi:hypothetical protein
MPDENIDSLSFFLCTENLSLDQLDTLRLEFPSAHFAVRPATQLPYISISFQPHELSGLLSKPAHHIFNQQANIYIDVQANSHFSWGDFLLPAELIKAANDRSLPIRIAFATS